MSSPIVVEVRVAAAGDDVEERTTGSVALTSSDLELVVDGTKGQTVGLRFTGIDIPQGAVITKAYIQFQTDEARTGAASLEIRGTDTDDAAAFASTKFNVSSRPKTDAWVSWTPPAWTTVGEAGPAQQTPELTAVVQEIVSRPGWLTGNDMAFLITGTGTRTAESFEGNAARAPLLHIEYVLPTGANSPPTGFTLSAGTVPENSATDTVVGAFENVADPDAGDTHTFSLVDSAGGRFKIVGSELQVANGSLLDFEAAATHAVTVRVTDSGAASFDKTFAITLTNANDAPAAVADTVATAANTPVTVPVLANDTDPDRDTLTVTTAVGAANGSLALNADSTVTYTPRAGFAGTDSFTYTASDGRGGTATGQVTVTVGAGSPVTLERRVVAGSDDAEERASGSVSLSSSDLELVDDLGSSSGVGQKVGLRFTGIEIPRGAVITKAYVQFQTDEVTTGASSLLIRGQDSDDAATFASTTGNVSTRPTTDASVGWQPAAWTTVGEAALAQRTPDLSAIVQEIVSRPGWAGASASDLAFIITGSGARTAEAFEGGSARAPLLHIEWIPGTPDTTPPTVTMDAPPEGATVSGVISLSATAFDNVAVQSVQFRLDSDIVSPLDTSAPYTFDLDTRTFADGTVALSAVAIDHAGNEAVSGPLTVTIDNGVQPPPPPPPPSGLIRVPEDYATIQAAVNAAGDGDTIIVGPGTYTGGIVVSGKSITLASQYHTTGDASFIDRTIISGGAPAVYVDSSAPDTIIKGFHFVGGTKSVQFFASGGQALDNFFDNTGSDAISFENVGGIARGNRIVSAGDDGIDVDHATGDVLIENNVIELSGDDGIEIRNQNYSGPLVTLSIRNNTITGSGEDGVQIIDYSALSNRVFSLERNLIRTSADAGLGLMDNGETLEDFRAASIPERIHVFNNTFDSNPYGITGGNNLIAVNNIVSNSSVLGLKNVDANSTVAYTLFFGNAVDHSGSNVDPATTITANPLYTAGFGLQAGSPAIDAGTALFVHNSETVLNIPPSEYSGTTVDLGWSEAGNISPAAAMSTGTQAIVEDVAGSGDVRIGGTGADTFIFSPGFGNDRIIDFDADPLSGQDIIEFAGGITAADIEVTGSGADTLVTVGNDPTQTILLVGVAADTVSQDDFHFVA